MGFAFSMLPNGTSYNDWTLSGCSLPFQCVDEGVDNAPDGNYLSTSGISKYADLYVGDGSNYSTPATLNPADPVNLIRVRLYWEHQVPANPMEITVLDRAGTQRAQWNVSNPDTNPTKSGTAWVDVSGLGLTVLDFHFARVRLNSGNPSAFPRVHAMELQIDYGVTLSTSSSSTSSTITTSTTSSSYYPYFSILSGAISLKLRAIINAVESGKKLKPIAKVIIIDTDTGEETIIDDVINFGVRVSTDASADSFSVVIGGSEIWSPRGTLYPNLVEVSQKKLFRIYGGYKIDQQEYYIPYFEGVPVADPMSVGGANRSISIRGYGKEQLLLKTDGYRAAYTGSAKELIEYYLQLAGIDNWWLAFDDWTITNQEMNYMNAYQAVASLLAVPGYVEFFFDPEGVFIAQAYGGTQEPELNITDENNLLYLNRGTYGNRIFTIVDVLGNTDEASATRYASQEKLDKYGRNIRVFSSSFITTQQEAEDYGDNVIAESLLYENFIQFRMPFLPYLRAGSIVTITDQATGTIGENVRLKSISVYFRAGHSSRIDATGVIV